MYIIWTLQPYCHAGQTYICIFFYFHSSYHLVRCHTVKFSINSYNVPFSSASWTGLFISFFFWDNEKKHNGLPCLLVCCLPRGILSRKLILETRRRYSIFKVFSDNFANRWRLRFSGPIAGRGFINVLYFLVFRVIFTQIDIMWLIWRSGWHRVTFFVFSN